VHGLPVVLKKQRKQGPRKRTVGTQKWGARSHCFVGYLVPGPHRLRKVDKEGREGEREREG
jgi:hypothetical protein